MEYRIKEEKVNGQLYFYPQWKKRWFWRRFVWWGGEDGTTPHTAFYRDMAGALREIAEDKENRKKKAMETPNKPIYHYIQ